MFSENLLKQISFIKEIDKVKYIQRKTKLFNSDRNENDAEHSWHLAVMAIVLAEHANASVDLLKVVKMVLIHDIVEIDAGDTFAYDTTGYADKDAREQKAADRLFGLLPDDQRDRLRSLWNEYEAQETPESQFANAVDRMQPAMLNHHAGDESPWKRHGVSYPQAVKRLSPIGDGSSALWSHTEMLIKQARDRGQLTEG